jgi:trehalose 6-phosphate phosphatase
MDVADLLCPSCALFLDFDGTLVDLAERPEDVVVPPALVDTLRELHTYLGGALAVISGRPIEQIDEFLAPLRLPVAGVHGAERRSADGTLSLQTTHPLDEVQRNLG